MPRPPAKRLTVTFHKTATPNPNAWWEAARPTGGKVRGGHMPIGRGVIPHDLGHLATESRLGIDHGFWGLLARGATFARGTDARPTKPGRALIASHREELERAESLGNHHHFAWLAHEPTPVGPTFDRLAAAWGEVPEGGSLTVEWPGLEPVVVSPAGHAERRRRS